MQQQQQQHQQPPQSQPQSQPPTLNSGASFPPNAITTEQIQKCLDDNKNLIMAILENQNLGKFQECAQYQAVLQKNLMYLAAIADAQPPAPGPPQQTSTPQMLPNTVPQQANSYMQQQHQAAQQQSQQQGGGVPKLPFQLNALRTQDQQQQLLQYQQQQQQQIKAQMGPRVAGGQNGMIGMHQAMQSSLANNPIGMKQDVSEAASGGDGQGGKSRS
ncbi:hypothetical protein QVD17_30917 [Tagetes erecta]|uniref:SS18 N-terminal domain-containing protein n=1 Tax=Tagetes erecta TaxID=13708 RepID=A0AAD8K2E3_TARER|nr:hypothetical protein QVD17_30917 [Tagetes erecta]